MWKCPNCETVNDGDKCIICGESRIDNRHSNDNDLAKTQIIPNLKSFDVKPRENDEEVRNATPSQNREYRKETTPVAEHDRLSFEARKPIEKMPEKKKINTSKTVWITILIIVVSLAVICGGAVAYCQVRYSQAKTALNKDDFDEAKDILGSILFYRDADELLLECEYRQAKEFIADGNIEKAREIIDGLDGYKDSLTLLEKCDYEEARSLMEEGKYSEALDFLKPLDYKNSKYLANECIYRLAVSDMEKEDYLSAKEQLEKLENTTEFESYYKYDSTLEEVMSEIYLKGEKYYEDGKYSQAKKYFEHTKDYSDTSKYLTLIKARESSVDLEELVSLIGFADTEKILLEDKYLIDFLDGTWSQYTDIKEGKYLKIDSGENSSEQNITYDSGNRFKIENGIHYIGYGDDMTAQWSYEIISENIIEVYVYSEGENCRLFKR